VVEDDVRGLPSSIDAESVMEALIARVERIPIHVVVAVNAGRRMKRLINLCALTALDLVPLAHTKASAQACMKRFRHAH